MLRRLSSQQSGFTLVEALVTTAIIVILFGLSTVSLGNPQNATNTVNAVDTLVNDLKAQQTAAMAGTVGSTAAQQSAGVLVQADQYTLFTGSTYSAGNGYNYVVSAPDGVTFSSTFPGETVLFSKGTGEVDSFLAGNNTITVTTQAGNKVITITRFGAITVT
jgi:prepilin-type N-terminal cleavage/methylation domain-containing protein